MDGSFDVNVANCNDPRLCCAGTDHCRFLQDDLDNDNVDNVNAQPRHGTMISSRASRDSLHSDFGSAAANAAGASSDRGDGRDDNERNAIDNGRHDDNRDGDDDDDDDDDDDNDQDDDSSLFSLDWLRPMAAEANRRRLGLRRLRHETMSANTTDTTTKTSRAEYWAKLDGDDGDDDDGSVKFGPWGGRRNRAESSHGAAKKDDENVDRTHRVVVGSGDGFSSSISFWSF